MSNTTVPNETPGDDRPDLCRNGHDKRVEGVRANGNGCNACKREAAARYRQARKAGVPLQENKRQARTDLGYAEVVGPATERVADLAPMTSDEVRWARATFTADQLAAGVAALDHAVAGLGAAHPAIVDLFTDLNTRLEADGLPVRVGLDDAGHVTYTEADR